MSLILMLFSLMALAGACGMSSEQKRQAPPKTAIINVNVWNGAGFSQNKTVILIGGIISNTNAAGATTVDAKGGYLIPGLIDTHCHITSYSYLNAMRQYGVTTALDMGTYPYSSVTACRAPGVTDVYGPGAAGTVNGTLNSHFPGLPLDSFIPNPTAARQFVADRVAQGVDYIKVILDPLGPDNETLAAVVQASHEAGKLVITHAPSYADYSQAEKARADIPCHVPLDKPIDATLLPN
jgi:imidazolonepropionase-like amidohydrolase